MQKNNPNITWKLYEVSTTAPDGTLLKGEIHYWSKDYSIYMTEPFKADGCSGHLMYAIPVAYATEEEDRPGVHMFRLVGLAKENLLTLYKKESQKHS